jgi:hypothetical protein
MRLMTFLKKLINPRQPRLSLCAKATRPLNVERLEDRECPAGLWEWVGAAQPGPLLWSNPAGGNWDHNGLPAGAGQYPGMPGSLNDDVDFTNAAAAPANLGRGERQTAPTVRSRIQPRGSRRANRCDGRPARRLWHGRGWGRLRPEERETPGDGMLEEGDDVPGQPVTHLSARFWVGRPSTRRGTGRLLRLNFGAAIPVRGRWATGCRLVFQRGQIVTSTERPFLRLTDEGREWLELNQNASEARSGPTSVVGRAVPF